VVCIAGLAAPAARAAEPVRPDLGRWEGQVGGATVVFTFEATVHGARYLVRPVVYCGPTEATYFEISAFTSYGPDAWPIKPNGVVRGSPLAGRFEDVRAKLKVVAAGTCLLRGTRVEVRPSPAAPTVFDGTWHGTLAEHPFGPSYEVVDFVTRGEGTFIDSDWGVYDGGPNCLIVRGGLEMLVAPDGSFGATINGSALNTQGVTLHLSGRFISSNVVEGSYTLSVNPDCDGGPVAFTATFSSAYPPPKPATGNVKLYRPKGSAGGPGGEKPPEGGECRDLASISPESKRLEKAKLPLGSFAAGPVPIAVSASAWVGSVGICDRAINALEPRLELTPPSLTLTASYNLKDRHLIAEPKYSFVPLGWQIPRGTGAPRPEGPTIDWGAAVNFGGEAAPTLDFGVNPLARRGGKLEVGLELVRVPVVQPKATLIALGRPVLEASLGPELTLSMKVDREGLQRAVEEATAEGESPAAAAEQVAEQARANVQAAVDAEESIAAPAEALPADAAQIAGAVSDDMAATLAADTVADPGLSAIEALWLEGAADPALIADSEEVAGELVITVGEVVAVEARAHRVHLPPGLHRSHGRLVLASPAARATARQAPASGASPGPFPVGRMPSLVRDTLALPVPGRVGPLVTTSTHLRPGRWVSVIAPFLAGGRRHDALLTLAGPGYRAVRLLRISGGAAGAAILLPRRMARGTWTISIEDLSGIALVPQGHALTGTAIVRIGVFEVGEHWK
jgi:hypothetical protein